jgi:transposase
MERIPMNCLRDLIHRLRSGESERRIARDLNMSRTTVAKYRAWAQSQGYLEPDRWLPDEATLLASLGAAPRPPQAPSGVEPYHEVVQELLDQNVEMVAIFQRLQEDYGYRGSYSSIRRYVHRMFPNVPEAFVRVQTAPGEEAQVDFGHAGQVYDPRVGRERTAYVFVATLSYSRHQYAELVFDQTVPTWIGLHRRAFESWGGVVRRVVPDNLKAAVKEVLVYDPVLGEAYRRMAQHYGFVISPTRPRTPRHKGKVESGVHYVARNFMAGQQFLDIDSANQRLAVWVRERAGTREHGTTHQAPLYLFDSYERAALLPLPDEAFTLQEIHRVKVRSDCHVVVDKSFYSVPYVHVGQSLDAHIDEHIVALYRDSELVATHPRCHKPGEWQTRLEHYPEEKAAYLRGTPEACRQRAAALGPATGAVVKGLLAHRPLDRLRSVQAILRLEEGVGAERLEAACARALYFGDARYRRIKEILKAGLDREPLTEDMALLPARAHLFARAGTEFFDVAAENEEVEVC